MNESAFKIFGVVLLITFLIYSPESAGAQAVFRGRLFAGGAVREVVNVAIDIEGYSTEEELKELQQHLSLNDLDGFYSAFRSMKKGILRYIGSTGLNISFNAAQEKPTDQGVQIFLVTETRSVEPGARKTRVRRSRFLVVVLDLDKDFTGEGTVYEDAQVKFTRQGIEMGSSYSMPKKIVNLELVK